MVGQHCVDGVDGGVGGAVVANYGAALAVLFCFSLHVMFVAFCFVSNGKGPGPPFM